MDGTGLAEQLEIEDEKPHYSVIRVSTKQRDLIQQLRPAERRVALVKAALAKKERTAQS